VAEIPQGYRDVPEEDRKKAKVFFDRGRTVADTGNYEYAIEMYLQGLAIDPDEVSGHQALRDISLRRKASGGKDLGMLEKMRIKSPTKDDKQNMLNCEKMLAYDPGNTDRMLCIMQNAHRAGFYDTVMWIGPILQKANADSPKPEFNKFILLKDIYKDLKQWKLATDACHYAVRLRPEDMDLQTELKNLGAQHTMDEGKYGTAGSFRQSMRDVDKQGRLLEQDKDVRSMDSLERSVVEAQAEYDADPTEPSKLTKLVEALERTDRPEYENRAMEALQREYERTKQYRYRQRIGRINMKQLSRIERAKRAELQANPKDEALQREYKEFKNEQLEFELKEYQQWAENYPTDTSLRYETGVRMFLLKKFDDAIPVLQQARSDPKYKTDATIFLSRAFLESGYVDEANESLEGLIKDYGLHGDTKSKEMYYWRGRALELKKQNEDALKLYSRIAQWDFGYRDVQSRIKRLRTVGPTPA
jgi:tetratricopeptide (TPR) repeat protein